MNICVISDLHGSDRWRAIVEQEKDRAIHFVFLGDYFDDKAGIISPEEQWANFQEICDFQNTTPNVVLLIGNHDLQYIGGVRCREYSLKLASLVVNQLMEVIRDGRMQVCVQYGEYLFSHAGISTVWMRNNGFKTWRDVNKAFWISPLCVDFVNKINADIYGNDTFQSPLWIRPAALADVLFPDCRQVIGHSTLDRIYVGEAIVTDTDGKEYVVIDAETKLYRIEKC